MGLERRVNALERAASGKDSNGPCPACGFTPDAVRTLVIVRPGTVDIGAMDEPGRPRCSTCGGLMPPVEIVEAPCRYKSA